VSSSRRRVRAVARPVASPALGRCRLRSSGADRFRGGHRPSAGAVSGSAYAAGGASGIPGRPYALRHRARLTTARISLIPFQPSRGERYGVGWDCPSGVHPNPTSGGIRLGRHVGGVRPYFQCVPPGSRPQPDTDCGGGWGPAEACGGARHRRPGWSTIGRPLCARVVHRSVQRHGRLGGAPAHRDPLGRRRPFRGPSTAEYSDRHQRSVGQCHGDRLFHSYLERGPRRRRRESEAKAVCHRCPVITECRVHALRVHEPYGIWGGLSEEDRATLLRTRRPIVAVPTQG